MAFPTHNAFQRLIATVYFAEGSYRVHFKRPVEKSSGPGEVGPLHSVSSVSGNAPCGLVFAVRRAKLELEGQAWICVV